MIQSNQKINIMNCFKRILPACVLLTSIGVGTYVVYKENIKTYMRLHEKVKIDLPNDYVPKTLESKLSKLLRNAGIQGVHVLYEPKGSGKTTAIKKVLNDIQDQGASDTLTLYDWNNNNQRYQKTFHIKPMYIDLNERSLDFSWENELGRSNHGFVDTIQEDTKVVIVLDHMSKNIIDGFDQYGLDSKARDYISYYAPLSYNNGFKFVIVVVTNDREYAKNILQCNGCQKVHQIFTDHDINGKLQTDAMIEASKKLDRMIENLKDK